MTLLRTRRTILAAASSSFLLNARGGDQAGEAMKLVDPATEFELLRVTGEKHNSWLPLPENRALTRKGDAVVFASDRGGRAQLYRHEFKTNKVRVLTEAAQLNRDCFGLDSADKRVLFVDGSRLMQVGAGGGRDKKILDVPENTGCFDSAEELIVYAAGSRLFKGTAEVARVEGSISNLTLRPRAAGAVFLAAGSLYYSALSGAPKQLAKDVLCARWSPGGEAVLYLKRTASLTELREVAVESGEDTLVARTSQFGYFQRNADASVFLGASGSAAQPNLVLLLRSVKRELTVSEHKASSAALTRAAFSVNSSRLVYQTDRAAKMVIYAMNVDKLVEQTDEA